MTCSTSYRKIVSGEAGGIGAGLARGALGLLSVPYRWGSSVVEVLQTGQGGARVGLPVISVGNLTAGGTGKTPFVGYLIGKLQGKGLRPVVLSRGYKAAADGRNDEARVLDRAHPDVIHLQDKDRATLAATASTAQLGDVLLLDDGFQYHKLARDLNVCLIDATNPWGYGAVLPRGLLRETPSSLYRARPVVITRAELAGEDRIATLKQEILAHNEHAKIVVSEMRLTQVTDAAGAKQGDAASLSGKRVLLASGIGNPDAFARNVRATGARVAAHAERGDHHEWTAEDVAELVRAARAQAAEMVLTTVKDAVKLAALDWPADDVPLRAVDVEVHVTEGEDVLDQLLDEALARS
jgi:tetraacyldisaccharide 4'-kinase